MKTMQRRMSSLLCALLLLCTLLPTASAAQNAETVQAKFWYDTFDNRGLLYVDGEPVSVADDAHPEWCLILYGGAFYLPAQIAGEWLGASLSWDGKAAVLTTAGQPVYRSYSMDKRDLTQEERHLQEKENLEGAALTLRPDVTVTWDGKEIAFSTATGDPVYPGICQNTLYLPLRGVAGLCGKEILFLPAVDEEVGAEGSSIPDLTLPFQPRFKHTSRGALFLFDMPTKGQLDAAQNYLNQIDPLLYDGITGTLREFLSGSAVNNAQAIACLQAVSDYLDQISALPLSDTPSLQPYLVLLHKDVEEFQQAVKKFSGEVERHTQFPVSLQQMTSVMLCPYLYKTYIQIADTQRLLDAVCTQAGL